MAASKAKGEPPVKRQKTNPPEKSKNPKSSQPAARSTEFVSDSDLESGAERLPITTPQTSILKKKIDSIIRSKKKPQKASRPPVVESSREQDSDKSEGEDSAESEGETDSSSDDTESENDNDGGQPQEVVETHQTQLAHARTAPELVAASMFTPPPGFDIFTDHGSSDLNASKLLSKDNLSGKQIWYFTASATVPVHAIKKISLQNIKEGSSILSYNGNDYGFVQEKATEQGSNGVMVPSGRDGKYRSVKSSVDQTFHLQRLVRLPNFVTGKALASNSPSVSSQPTVTAQKFIRQQPAGLKMRFRPIGFGDGRTGAIGTSSSSYSSSDSEDADGQPAFRKPLDPNSTELEATRSEEDASDNDDGTEMIEAPASTSLPQGASNTCSSKTKSEKSGDKQPKAKKPPTNGTAKSSGTKPFQTSQENEKQRPANVMPILPPSGKRKSNGVSNPLNDSKQAIAHQSKPSESSQAPKHQKSSVTASGTPEKVIPAILPTPRSWSSKKKN